MLVAFCKNKKPRAGELISSGLYSIQGPESTGPKKKVLLPLLRDHNQIAFAKRGRKTCRQLC